MTGFRAGLGALLVRKEAAQQLNKVYFSGGKWVLDALYVIYIIYMFENDKIPGWGVVDAAAMVHITT
jgi:hypothetical protein